VSDEARTTITDQSADAYVFRWKGRSATGRGCCSKIRGIGRTINPRYDIDQAQQIHRHQRDARVGGATPVPPDVIRSGRGVEDHVAIGWQLARSVDQRVVTEHVVRGMPRDAA
jgi:hypothetical protein